MIKFHYSGQENSGGIKPQQTRPDSWQIVRCVHLPLTQRYCPLNNLSLGTMIPYMCRMCKSEGMLKECKTLFSENVDHSYSAASFYHSIIGKDALHNQGWIRKISPSGNDRENLRLIYRWSFFLIDTWLLGASLPIMWINRFCSVVCPACCWIDQTTINAQWTILEIEGKWYHAKSSRIIHVGKLLLYFTWPIPVTV